MYEIYITRAIIYSQKNFLEKSKKIILFTEEFGFINVSAHAIANEKSKNKHLLQNGNLIKIYMVVGKNK